ncbi:uncharacterized protein LOC143282420 [Babylonia areolata]|uniref:uncharacterized protein LOC143282420 n=1 Tax=Babylonia areolata TaxID=304850 RepID=UPI003FCFF06F
MAGALPNGPLQVAFSFDTTGSMSGALTEVRGRLSDMLQRLQTDIPAVTTAVIAHGDYQDVYVTKHIDFTDNLPQLVDFVNNVGTTGGGDEPEAYEVMLRLVRRDLKWSPGSQRVLVVIGDAFPHPPSFHLNKDKIDWKKETQMLQEMGVRIYGVQVNSSNQATEFFKTMTTMTDGQHLKLSQFGTLCDVIMAICYREKGAEFFSNYEAEVRAREGRQALHKDLEGVFGVLRRADSSASTAAAPSAAKAAKSPAATTAASAVTKISKGGKKPSTKKSVTMSTAKKLVARAAKTTDSKPKSKRFTKRILVARRLNREKVPDTNFRLRQLKWSPWQLAVVSAEEDTKSGQWRRFMGGVAKVRGGGVLGGGSSARAQRSVMCEAAVQTRPGARRHVVWCRVLPASSANRLSLSRLFMAPSARAQMDRVIRSGCRVWVRWARIGQHEEVKQQVKDIYDYAWCARKGCQRDVWVPNGVPSHRVQICGSLVA